MLPRLSLWRFFYGRDATLGSFALEGHLIYTLEDAWKANQVGVSCIPDGLYICRPRRFNAGDQGRGYDAWEICDVPGRSLIKIHRGNHADHVKGCIVVGRNLGVLEGQLAVLDSMGAWIALSRALSGKQFELDIRPMPPLAGTGSVAA